MGRVLGTGATLVGRLEHPAIAPTCYRQFALTVLGVPLWFGRFRMVTPDEAYGADLFGRPMSGGEVVRRVGLMAYLRFKLGVLLAPLGAIAVCAFLVGRPLWMMANLPR